MNEWIPSSRTLLLTYIVSNTSPIDSMDPPAAAAATGFSGFLPAAALVDFLLHASAEVASIDKLPLLQTRNVSSAVRRVKLLYALFEDVRDSDVPLPPSSVICLTELFSVIRHTKALIDDFVAGSALWNLVQTEHVSQQLHTCAREMGRALDILPLRLLRITADVREQVELLHRQAKRADAFVDPRERRLREELLQIMAADGKAGTDRATSAAGGGIRDSKKVEEIMWRIGLRSPSDYQEETSRLEAESRKQAGTGGVVAVANINNLIALLAYAKSGGPSETVRREPEPEPQHPESFPKGLNRSSTWSASSSPSFSSTVFNVPDEFRCPITLELMRDPVSIASGHTYDRSSIARWINSGHHTCPKSGQKLIHMALIPNYALKSLIGQWCNEHNDPLSFWDRESGGAEYLSPPSPAVHAVDHISATKAATEAVRMTAEFLVGKLAMGSPDIQRQATYELRLLAKTGMDNRRIIAEAGAIPFLVTLLGSRDPRTQENAVTALLNLSIFDNNKVLIIAAGAVDAVVQVLRSGSAMEARENAAATIFSLSMLDECKVTIGARPEAVAGLVGLLREGTAAGKRDAATALFNLAAYSGNRAGVVAAGAVPLLVGLLVDERAGITDDALAVLGLLCGCGEGMKEIGGNLAVLPVLVDLVRLGSPKGKESAVSLLLGLCRDGGEEMGRRMVMNPLSVPSLQSLAAAGSPKARRKAEALLRFLNRDTARRLNGPL